MSKRDGDRSRLRYLVLAIMLVAFSAVAVTTSKADPEILVQATQH